MTFIVYSQVSEKNLSGSLGMPEYSYYFVLRGFLPVLKELGQVVVVNNPEQEVDVIYDDCRKRGEECVFLSFSPPFKSAIGLRCPTICVIAWEYNRIPDEAWDSDLKNDWRYVFSYHSGAITLSRYAANAVRKAMGEKFPVEVIPVPVWETFDNYRNRVANIYGVKQQEISIKGNALDNRQYIITADSFELAESFDGFNIKTWAGETLKLGFTSNETDEYTAYLGGFYAPEEWGTWSRIENPRIVLPHRLSGVVHIKIVANCYAYNADKELFVSLGDEKKRIMLKHAPTEVNVSFHLSKPENVLKFSGLDLSMFPESPTRDTRTMGIGLSYIEISGDPDADVVAESFDGFNVKNWAGETLKLGFTETDESAVYLGGFYPPDPWCTWSRIENPWILLSHRLSGVVHLKICACGYANNADKEIFVSLGDEKKRILLEGVFTEIGVSFHLSKPENVLKFSGLDLSPLVDDSNSRSIGIGLLYIEISGNPDADVGVEVGKKTDEAKGLIRKVSLDGVVYTSVLNPYDGRKNWWDMVTAFGFAFKNVEDATLVLKMTNNSLLSYMGILHSLFQQMWPFKCRIVALQGYMDDVEYEKLIAATSFYVNASHCEGLCLPLMEFMACNIPSIAPCHTAMADYIDSSSTLIVKSSLEPCLWSHDPRWVFRTMRYRIDWGSLVNAFRESYDITKNQPDLYRAMSTAAASHINKFATNNIVKEKLQKFFAKELGFHS